MNFETLRTRKDVLTYVCILSNSRGLKFVRSGSLSYKCDVFFLRFMITILILANTFLKRKVKAFFPIKINYRYFLTS